ncbi:MAG TPA: PVC-type heme-binding CxxCH protein [Pirellulales bacterium]|nr:PVC-type heme-binding CxxCH protein [Pirellulales bacterium]
MRRHARPGLRAACLLAAFLFPLISTRPASAADSWLSFPGQDGPGKGKKIVLVSGDEEYRSEEALPMLAKILSRRHGFNCTVHFAIDPQSGIIDSNNQNNIPGLEQLDDADLMIIATRFRELPDDQMKHVVDFVNAGKPVIGLRTATHAFNYSKKDSPYVDWGFSSSKWPGGFGQQILGDTWISHHGNHGHEATRGIVNEKQKDNPVLRGVSDVFGQTDVYGIKNLTPDASILLYGQVVAGMKPTDPPVAGEKNNPMMPVAWLKPYTAPSGKKGQAFCTTMGASIDFTSEGLRRLIVNAAYYLTGLGEKITGQADVALVGKFEPSFFGFKNNDYWKQKALKPSDFASVADDSSASSGGLHLKKGDHIAIIGNTLGERMQHDGWLETLIHSRFPDYRLSFRNLAFSADELTIRQRSEGFGSPDEWLGRTKAGVVFAFFGFNESFAGERGLDKFRQDLDGFIKLTLEQKYNGQRPPRLVLFSPIAHEDVHNPNLPDGHHNNARLELYTAAMAEVAKANGVTFVDLFRPTREQYKSATNPLTINGIHLDESGNRFVAETIINALFAGKSTQLSGDQLAKLRDAVVDKNFYWFHRYRTTDGYSSYGGRSYLKFVDGQTNREVMMRELEVLDVMTANRDKRVWEVAQGRDLSVDDGNTPPFIPVKTNKPGSGPNGEHVFLGGEEAIGKMTIAKGLKVGLFASEEMFPEMINPVQMAFDTKGRLWVATWPTYPHWKPKEEMNDKLLILEDTDGDGKADKCQTFADHLHNPTGFEFWNGGVYVAMAPDLIFLKDTDGDDKADVRVRVLHGLDSADTHHTANSFVFDPGGGLYFQEGVFHRTQVETPYGPQRNTDACVWRFEPRTFKFERYVPYGFANPHGHVFDRWGQDIVHDGTGAQPYHGAIFSGYVDFPQKHPHAPQVYNQRTRPCPATEILSSRHFPDDMQDNLLVGNVIGFQGLLRYRLDNKGASIVGTELEPFLSSSDPNFRPSDFEIGADGTLYFTDWQNPIIGHMQHNLRDPSRDRIHGRVYRVTYEGRPLSPSPKVAGEPIEKLLDLLKHDESRVRYRARIELSGRSADEVLAAAKTWVKRLSPADESYEHHLLEALWLHQQYDVVDADLLHRVLAAKDGRARAAATRVLCCWRERLPQSLDEVKKLAADSDPLVRLEAVRAASYFRVPEAFEAALVAGDTAGDPYLEYTREQTMKSLEPLWKQALAEKREIPLTTEAGARFLLKHLSLDQLLSKERSRPVYYELLFRPGVRDEFRREALGGLAKIEKKNELDVLIDAVGMIDSGLAERDETVVFDLVRLLTGRGADQLAAMRGHIEKFATSSKQPIIRQAAFAALIGVDGDPGPSWQLATKKVSSLYDLVGAVPLVSDPSLRARLYPLVEPLLRGLPEPLSQGSEGKGTLGRYVRIELPRRGTLTLAEVEVFAGGGRNVARHGKATQKNTGYGGEASRAIDGNTSGSFGGNGQTHTEENTPDPWWEVDLGETYPLERIVVYNRSDADLGKRLDGFTLRVLDGDRHEVFKRTGLPAPESKVQIDLEGGGGADLVRRAAMNALTYVRGQEAQTFGTLATFVLGDAQGAGGKQTTSADLLPAIRAMQRIGRQHWDKARAKPLLNAIVPAVRKLPAEDRTSEAALDELEFADALAALLPIDEARQVRGELRELGVRVIKLGTLPERMSYDQDVLAVAAGKPLQFVLDNADLMPHNFVIVEPGALEEVGLLGEATAQQPGALSRHYVPPSNKILLASQLLQPRASQRLTFNAPTRPGVYPYVCTFPGHWRRMYGALYVVEDLDQYLAGPEAYLAANPLEVKDDLLKDRRPRTEWKFDELAVAVADLSSGRSFGDAKQMFTVASCVACHKLNGVGTEIGPDLSKLDPKYQPIDILKEILDPSAKINEKYQTYTFLLDSGKTVTGLVLEETADMVKVIENPLAKAEPVVIKKSEIDEREKAKTSIMPKGLLDKLARDEILDLIAYIAARGDQTSELFKGGEGHEHHH